MPEHGTDYVDEFESNGWQMKKIDHVEGYLDEFIPIQSESNAQIKELGKITYPF